MDTRGARNRTITCTAEEIARAASQCPALAQPVDAAGITDRIFFQDFFQAVPFLPPKCVDLLILDPPYNLTKNYGGRAFHEKKQDDYQTWFERVIAHLLPVLKPTATVYVCSDWRTSTLIFPILDSHFRVQNRITWEREKGRGARRNWKNNTEDIWFCTLSNDYCFNLDAVKLSRRVIAPYRNADGSPKDWQQTQSGNFRLTHPSNLWTDITVPFWSMRENTSHPTQKPEKLIAKLILASSNEGDLILDPFSGSGTTAVVARKLKRHFCGIEQNVEYCAWTLKRLQMAENEPEIQGYHNGVFWERNTTPK